MSKMQPIVIIIDYKPVIGPRCLGGMVKEIKEKY